MKKYNNPIQTIQNTVNTSTHFTKTPTHTHTHTLQNPQTHMHTHAHSYITKQVISTTVQDTHQMK